MLEKNDLSPKGLLAQPLQRVGYSDRTAWLMACMSELAYVKFEEISPLSSVIDDISRAIGRSPLEVSTALRPLLDQEQRDAIVATAEQKLSGILNSIDFDLLLTFNNAETQGFMAKRRSAQSRSDMMVLAFRGTEKKLKDWKTDLRIELRAVSGTKGRIHAGFLAAYDAVSGVIQEKVEEHAGVPLFVTGHSLGGALAIVATRFLRADRLAACYTFGSPRVGDRELSREFRTPIYRVVNAADGVPRIPVGSGMWFAGKVLDWLTHALPRWRFLDSLRGYAERITGYVHYGDMRYLTAAKPGPSDSYPDLGLISNPNVRERWSRLWRRVKDTHGQGLVKDHAIVIYRRKLRAYAVSRN